MAVIPLRIVRGNLRTGALTGVRRALVLRLARLWENSRFAPFLHHARLLFCATLCLLVTNESEYHSNPATSLGVFISMGG
jgi:hypothetical protein